jgi:hypothetical protein
MYIGGGGWRGWTVTPYLRKGEWLAPSPVLLWGGGAPRGVDPPKNRPLIGEGRRGGGGGGSEKHCFWNFLPRGGGGGGDIVLYLDWVKGSMARCFAHVCHCYRFALVEKKTAAYGRYLRCISVLYCVLLKDIFRTCPVAHNNKKPLSPIQHEL